MCLRDRINTDATSEAEKFSDIISRFYIIVNGGEALLRNFEGTEAELKETTVDFTPSTGSVPTLLTSGPSAYSPTPSSGDTEENKKVVFVSRLFRAYAKVTVRVQFNDASASLSDMTATITNIPTKIALYTAGGGSSNSKYPATIDDTTMKTTETDFSGLTSTAGSSAYFCMQMCIRDRLTITNSAIPCKETSLSGTISLTVDGKPMSVACTNQWERGKIYTYTVTIKPTGLELSGINVVGWQDAAQIPDTNI